MVTCCLVCSLVCTSVCSAWANTEGVGHSTWLRLPTKAETAGTGGSGPPMLNLDTGRSRLDSLRPEGAGDRREEAASGAEGAAETPTGTAVAAAVAPEDPPASSMMAVAAGLNLAAEARSARALAISSRSCSVRGQSG